MNPKKTDNSDEEILKIARERFDLAVAAEANMREVALEDLKFRAGDQWDETIKHNRDADGRPCITINKVLPSIRQVTNEQRQNRQSTKVNPVDDKADIETAKILQGIIRHIEYNSNADAAYDTAFDGSVTKGLGYFRVITDFVDPTSFEQEILIKRIKNSFSVYLDPTYQEPDGSDANWGFIFEDVTEDDYKARYKKSKLSSMNDWSSVGDTRPGWVSDKTCRVAEYFYKTFKETEIYLLNNGQVIEKEKLPEFLPKGIEIVSSRETVLPAIKWCKINGIEILEKTDWLGLWIPIIPVLGDELDIEGERILEGMVRHAKDSNRMYNYFASSEVETIALAPRAPFIGAVGQFEGHEEQWRTANQKNYAYLEYNPESLQGQLLPPPQRNAYEPPIMAITQARMHSSEDIKATTGIYDASLGARSNENSGVAIQRRNNQSQTSNFHYTDNLTRSKRHLGRILIDLIPKVYDTARAARIIGEDGEPEIIRINEFFKRNGQEVKYSLGVGKYDVAVSTGPSFETKRQEARESMLALNQSFPKMAEVAGDLMVNQMDWPGAQEIAERLKKTLPPNLVEDKNSERPPLPPEVQQQMGEMNQLIEQLTQRLEIANQQVNTKVLELESKERIEFSKMEIDLRKEQLKTQSQAAMLIFQQELEQINQRLNLLSMNEPIENEMPGSNESLAPQAYNQPLTGELAPAHLMEGQDNEY